MHLQRQPTLELFSKEEPEIPEDNILNPIYSSLEQQGWPQKDTSTGSRHPEDSSKGLCAPGQGGSLSAHAARLKIQKALSKAVVETWAEMSVLGRKFYNKIESKTPPSKFPLCF